MGTSKENLSKSSGAMEAAGALDIFSHSVEKYKLVIQYYIDDGDTSSFKIWLPQNHMKIMALSQQMGMCWTHSKAPRNTPERTEKTV